MNLIDKLALSERQGMISLIKEGIFFRCYEQSLFSLIHLHYPTLAVRGRSFKNLKGKVVFSGGFPESKITKLFSEAEMKKMPWGIEVVCAQWDEGQYALWRKQCVSDTHQENEGNALTLSQGKWVQLNEEACRFLSQWEPSLYPDSVDKGFILGIKQAWGFMNNDK